MIPLSVTYSPNWKQITDFTGVKGLTKGAEATGAAPLEES